MCPISQRRLLIYGFDQALRLPYLKQTWLLRIEMYKAASIKHLYRMGRELLAFHLEVLPEAELNL